MRRLIALVVVVLMTGACSSGTKDTANATRTTTTDVQETTTTTLPAPVTYTGSGHDIIDIKKPADVSTATIAYNGAGNFSVESLDKSQQEVDLLVNTIGRYSGTVLVDPDTTETTALEITASGPWTIILNSALAAPRFDKTIAGNGDDVQLYTGDSGRAAIKYTGTSNFAVHTYGTDGSDLVVNEIGSVSGTYRWAGGPAIVQVTAEGSWSISVT